MSTDIVIIGNGMVGHRFIEEMVATDSDCTITTFCEEPYLAYDRVGLSSYFDGKSKADLSLVSPGFYDDHRVNVLLGDKAETIDRAGRIVHSASGKAVPYDVLVLATGSYPFVPPIEGRDQDHIHVYRTFDDLDAIKTSAENSTSGVVLGGGLLGLECGNALKNLGLEAHIVEFAPHLMGVQLDSEGASVLQEKIEDLGVQVHCGKNTRLIGPGEQARYKLSFADESELETDMVVFSVGIRPRDELGREAGLETGERGGIVVDNECRTSDPHIFAIGECALWSGRIFGLVAPGYTMAGVAADVISMVGERRFEGADMSTKLKLLGVDVASFGDSHAHTEGARAFRFRDDLNGIYKKIVIDAAGEKLLGGCLVGEAEEYGQLQQMMLHGLPLPEDPRSLILPALAVGGDPVGSPMGLDALPDVATICSCHNVTKGDIVDAVADGCTTIGGLKACTKAGTGCGGCATMAKQLLDSELTKAGIEVDNNLCEHFAYSRQDLYDLVRVRQLKTFDDVLQAVGQGCGCEVCKPAVASILATCWNEHIQEETHFGLQDTNDRYLANMQKDGTYSIVPRVAGGEITPEKLIVLGQVAQKYGLYTKITGGQRVDLFGAQVHQLPPIWEELIAAGFESGHAYGKALRTVKSCVGTSWCRYGQDDSVSLAIELENRYKGLRSPHKIKMAVSGCTRECAEAQGKDVGVIATDQGWNLYVCGNGGIKPRHADLLATDLDKETLITYIDRFFMYYVRCADRLERTATWMEKMEGGLDHLKAVIIDDSLGICAQLEQEMAYVVDTYQCEWKTAVEDPEKRKRYRTFVNSDETDPDVIFVQERDQIRPATADEKSALLAQQSA